MFWVMISLVLVILLPQDNCSGSKIVVEMSENDDHDLSLESRIHRSELDSYSAKMITVCLRYQTETLGRTPRCVASLSVMGISLFVLDRGRDMLSVRGSINDMLFLSNDYEMVPEPPKKLWALPDKGSNNNVTCVGVHLDPHKIKNIYGLKWSEEFPVTVYSRKEQYGPVLALAPLPQNVSDVSLNYYNYAQQPLTARLKNISRMQYIDVNFTIGCDVNHDAVKDVRGQQSFHGSIHGLNVYYGQFEVKDFIWELGCKENNIRLKRLVSMSNLVYKIRNINAMFGPNLIQVKDGMLCQQMCEKSSSSSKEKRHRSRHCLLRDAMSNVHSCHKLCHKIPHSVESVDFCMNCIVYYQDCPLVEHLGRRFHGNKRFTEPLPLVIELLSLQRNKLSEIRNILKDIPENTSCTTVSRNTREKIENDLRNCSETQVLETRKSDRKYLKSKCEEMVINIRRALHHLVQKTNCGNSEPVLEVLQELDKIGNRCGNRYGAKLLLVGKSRFQTWLSPVPAIGCYTERECYWSSLGDIVETCLSVEGLYWDLNDNRAVAFYDEVRCSKLLATFHCVARVIGDLAYSRKVLLQHNESDPLHKWEILQLATYLGPTFTSRFCLRNFNITVPIATSCMKLLVLPIKWGEALDGDFVSNLERYSREPKDVRLTDVTIRPDDLTTSHGVTTSNFTTTEQPPVSTSNTTDIDKILLIVLGSCIGILVVVIATVCMITWSWCRSQRKSEFVLMSTLIEDRDPWELEPLPRPPDAQGGSSTSGLFFNASYSGSLAGSSSSGVGSSHFGMLPNSSYSLGRSQSSLNSAWSGSVDSGTPLLGPSSRNEQLTRPETTAIGRVPVIPCPSRSPPKIPRFPTRPPPSAPKGKHRLSVYVNPRYVAPREKEYGYVKLSNRGPNLESESESGVQETCFTAPCLAEETPQVETPQVETSCSTYSPACNIYTILEEEEVEEVEEVIDVDISGES